MLNQKPHIMKITNVPMLLLIAFACLQSCVSADDLDAPIATDDAPINSDDPLANLNIPASFDFKTSTSVTFSLETVNVAGDTIPFAKATFDDNGNFNRNFTLLAGVDSVLVRSSYLGLTNKVMIPVQGNSATMDYRPLYDRNNPPVPPQSVTQQSKYGKVFNSSSNTVAYTYLSDFDFWGVPKNLVFPDPIEQNLLDDINASLPEFSRVPNANPEYLAGAETSLVITEEADVWVTFVAEGAGFRNALGYYSYPVGQAPNSVDEITAHNIIFPNVSFPGSGGALYPGDRVYLGRFPANTVVSWFLVADGWNGFFNGVGQGRNIHYSEPTVLLYDAARELAILGFEDLPRDGGSDDDFNDAIFYARSNPVDAIQIGDFVPAAVANDEDGDGVNDELDDYPADPNRAFNNFAPSVNSTGKLVFEDLWPSIGDYDFNDLVTDYTFNLIANGDNMITSIEASFTIEEIGGSLRNGLGFVLPINPNFIASIDNQLINADYVTVAANGTEVGSASDEAIIFVAADVFDHLGETFDINITFNTPVSSDDLGDIPFNAFLVVNGNRSREIHLPDLPPTSKGLGLAEGDDFSDPLIGRYYKTSMNLPWALNIYDGFEAPPEAIPITLQYPRFRSWANSGGTQDLDWYVQ